MGGDVGEIDHIEIDELDPWRADGGQLQGHLPADGAYADHRGFDLLQALLRHEFLLADESRGLLSMAGLLEFEEFFPQILIEGRANSSKKGVVFL